MATIGRALTQVKSQLDQWVPAPVIEQVCRDHGHRWRKRMLGPADTIHLMLLHLLAQVSMAALRHVSKVRVSAQAFCAARMRLPLSVMHELVRRACPAGPPLSCWKGLRVFAADGLSFLTEDTPQLAKRYGKAKNAKGSGNGRPNCKLLAVMDLDGGFIHQVTALPWARQERACLARLFAACGKSALLLGDRGLVGFAQVALMLAAQVHGCLRLPRWLVVQGRGRANHRRVRRLGRQDLLVVWRRGDRPPKWMSRRRWADLPRELVLRQIAFRVTRKGFRANWAWVVTTLTDPTLYPAQGVVDLYAKRWQVEVYFRDLKQTLGLGRPASRTPQGVRKELLAFVILYNLVRQVMARAAARQGVEADRISFSDALTWLLWSAPGEELPNLIVNPRRKRDTQPRALKHCRRKYARMSKPRATLLKPACEAKL